MDAHFTVAVDQEHDLIRVEMGGFFSATDVELLRMTIRTKLAMLSCGANQHLTLCDVTAMKIQAQDIVKAFSTVVGDPDLRSRRLAFVTGSSLARMQTRRLTDRDGVEFFTDPRAAEAWLLA